MGRQIGFFLLFVGMIVAFVFAASLELGTPQFTYCLAGLLLISFGVFLVFRNRSRPEPANRFRVFKRNRKKKE